MVSGILEVVLVDAVGLGNTECLFGGIDPYVVIRYKSQERESSVARGEGSNPVWDEKFTFRVQYPGDGQQCKLTLRIMDKDTFSADDFIGEATIYLEDLIAIGVEKGTAEMSPRKYSVVKSDRSYDGAIRVGITFTPKVEDNEEFGGWKHNSN